MRYAFRGDQLKEFVDKIKELENQETCGDTEFYSLMKPRGEMVIFVGEDKESVMREALSATSKGGFI
jgi:hypothetical protein